MAKNKLIIGGLCLAALALAALFLLRPTAPSVTTAPAAFPAPAFSWQDFDGKNTALAAYQGRVVILHFWASWCAPCKAEFPQLLAAAKQQPDVIFLALSSDSDRKAALQFLKEMGAEPPPANLLLGWDAQKKITYDLFMTSAYPETIMLDKQHRLRRKVPGVVEWQSPEIKAYLVRLLAE